MAPTRTASLRSALALPVSCSVCGSDQIAVDEVHERGLWRLSECARCENRWTEGPFDRPRRPVARAVTAQRTREAEAA